MGYTRDSETSETSETGIATNRTSHWPKVGRVVEEALGAILVAIVLGLVGAWYSLWVSVAANRDLITAHKYEIKSFREFHAQGARFTQHDAQLLISDIENMEERVDDVGDRVASLEQRCNAIGVEMARLPPPQWQSRILELERGLSGVKGQLEGKSNSIRRQ